MCEPYLHSITYGTFFYPEKEAETILKNFERWAEQDPKLLIYR